MSPTYGASPASLERLCDAQTRDYRERRKGKEREGRQGAREGEREERLSLIHSFSFAKIQKIVSEAILGH